MSRRQKALAGPDRQIERVIRTDEISQSFAAAAISFAATVQRSATRSKGAMLGSGNGRQVRRSPAADDKAGREEMQWNLGGAWSHSSARRSRRFLAMSSIIIGYSRSLPAVTSSISTTAPFTRGSMHWTSALMKFARGSPSNIDRVSETIIGRAPYLMPRTAIHASGRRALLALRLWHYLADILDCVVRFCTECNNGACGQFL